MKKLSIPLILLTFSLVSNVDAREPKKPKAIYQSEATATATKDCMVGVYVERRNALNTPPDVLQLEDKWILQFAGIMYQVVPDGDGSRVEAFGMWANKGLRPTLERCALTRKV